MDLFDLDRALDELEQQETINSNTAVSNQTINNSTTKIKFASDDNTNSRQSSNVPDLLKIYHHDDSKDDDDDDSGGGVGGLNGSGSVELPFNINFDKKFDDINKLYSSSTKFNNSMQQQNSNVVQLRNLSPKKRFLTTTIDSASSAAAATIDQLLLSSNNDFSSSNSNSSTSDDVIVGINNVPISNGVFVASAAGTLPTVPTTPILQTTLPVIRQMVTAAVECHEEDFKLISPPPTSSPEKAVLAMTSPSKVTVVDSAQQTNGDLMDEKEEGEECVAKKHSVAKTNCSHIHSSAGAVVEVVSKSDVAVVEETSAKVLLPFKNPVKTNDSTDVNQLHNNVASQNELSSPTKVVTNNAIQLNDHLLDSLSATIDNHHNKPGDESSISANPINSYDLNTENDDTTSSDQQVTSILVDIDLETGNRIETQQVYSGDTYELEEASSQSVFAPAIIDQQQLDEEDIDDNTIQQGVDVGEEASYINTASSTTITSAAASLGLSEIDVDRLFLQQMDEQNTSSANVDVNTTAELDDSAPLTSALEAGPYQYSIPGCLTESEMTLGQSAPIWVPDVDSEVCMLCAEKFTVVKRRHHCRACGRLLCSSCCRQKATLSFLEATPKSKEARVCLPCFEKLLLIEEMKQRQATSTEMSGGRKNPTISNLKKKRRSSEEEPQHQQSEDAGSPSSGREPSSRGGRGRRQGNKKVVFKDGFRPGIGRTLEGECLLPPEPEWGQWIPILSDDHPERFEIQRMSFNDVEQQLTDIGSSITVVVKRNLLVRIRRLDLGCCQKVDSAHARVWMIWTKGLHAVAQDEVVVFLQRDAADEKMPPLRHLLSHFNSLYDQALQGNNINEYGHSLIYTGVDDGEEFLGSRDNAGFLYLRYLNQCQHGEMISDDAIDSPYLIAVLIQRTEVPWAKQFPLRLAVSLGALMSCYPIPFISVRDRRPISFEIGYTIMNLLIDFRAYSYTLIPVRDCCAHLNADLTEIILPADSYNQLMRVLSYSNDNVIAWACGLSATADTHLAVEQNPETGRYTTVPFQQPGRNSASKDGASSSITAVLFVLFSASLRSANVSEPQSTDVAASVVEDGLMIQISSEEMSVLREHIKLKQDWQLGQVSLRWIDSNDQPNWNRWPHQLRSIPSSPIDHLQLSHSKHLRSRRDLARTDRFLLRLTDVYLLQSQQLEQSFSDNGFGPIVVSAAQAVCHAIEHHVPEILPRRLVAVRVTLGQDKVEYQAALPEHLLSILDSHMVPALHAHAPGVTYDMQFELYLYILDL